MGKYLEQLGQQVGTTGAQAATGNLLGMVFAKGQDKRQLRQQEKLQKLQLQGNKEMVDYNMMKELEMWKATNYSAQVEQLKAAGLNPGLLYGISGGGGTTTGSPGGGVTGATAPGGANEPMQMAQTIMSLGLQRAQKENIEADTALKGKQAETAGATTGKTNAETKLIEIEQQIKNLELSYGKDTYETRIHQLNILTDQALEQLQILRVQKRVDVAQEKDKVELLSKQVAGQIIENGLKQQKITESQEQINKWSEEIAQAWTHLDIQKRETNIKAFEAGIKAKYPGLWNVIGRIMNDTGRKIGEFMGEKHEPQEPPNK